jgi:hypothetical protein
VLSAALADVVVRLGLHERGALSITGNAYAMRSPLFELSLYIGLGLAGGLISVIFTKLRQAFSDLFTSTDDDCGDDSSSSSSSSSSISSSSSGDMSSAWAAVRRSLPLHLVICSHRHVDISHYSAALLMIVQIPPPLRPSLAGALCGVTAGESVHRVSFAS